MIALKATPAVWVDLNGCMYASMDVYWSAGVLERMGSKAEIKRHPE